MLGDPRKNCIRLQMHAQWYLSGGHRQMHRAYTPLACWVILATGPQAAFMTGAEFLGPAWHPVRASVTLTHPCQHTAAHLPFTRPPDVPYARRTVRARPQVSNNHHQRATSSLLQAFSPPSLKTCPSEGTSSYYFFLLLLVLSRSYSLYIYILLFSHPSSS